MAKKLGHKGAGITLANKIYALAQNTIPPRPNNQSTQLSASSCVDVLIITIKTSNTIITEMDKLARELPARVIAEIGDVRRFKNAGSIIAYAGLDAPPYQSGQYEIMKKSRWIDEHKFKIAMEQIIMWLNEVLKNKTYRHGGYTEFYVTEPKVRKIEKSRYIDRIVL